MSGLVSRIKTNLEPILDLADPRERIWRLTMSPHDRETHDLSIGIVITVVIIAVGIFWLIDVV